MRLLPKLALPFALGLSSCSSSSGVLEVKSLEAISTSQQHMQVFGLSAQIITPSSSGYVSGDCIRIGANLLKPDGTPGQRPKQDIDVQLRAQLVKSNESAGVFFTSAECQGSAIDSLKMTPTQSSFFVYFRPNVTGKHEDLQMLFTIMGGRLAQNELATSKLSALQIVDPTTHTESTKTVDGFFTREVWREGTDTVSAQGARKNTAFIQNASTMKKFHVTASATIQGGPHAGNMFIVGASGDRNLGQGCGADADYVHCTLAFLVQTATGQLHRPFSFRRYRANEILDLIPGNGETASTALLPRAAATDSKGNLYIAAYVFNNNAVRADAAVIKFDAYGNFVWANRINLSVPGELTAEDPKALALYEGSDGLARVVVGGQVKSNLGGLGTAAFFACIQENEIEYEQVQSGPCPEWSSLRQSVFSANTGAASHAYMNGGGKLGTNNTHFVLGGSCPNFVGGSARPCFVAIRVQDGAFDGVGTAATQFTYLAPAPDIAQVAGQPVGFNRNVWIDAVNTSGNEVIFAGHVEGISKGVVSKFSMHSSSLASNFGNAGDSYFKIAPNYFFKPYYIMAAPVGASGYYVFGESPHGDATASSNNPNGADESFALRLGADGTHDKSYKNNLTHEMFVYVGFTSIAPSHQHSSRARHANSVGALIFSFDSGNDTGRYHLNAFWQ